MATKTGAIPTFYNGVQFRSRLEAKWAAMFDMLGWRWTYEPFDSNQWIPDFELSSKFWRKRRKIVEVKPIGHIDELDDMAHEKIRRSYAGDPILILGRHLEEVGGIECMLGGDEDAHDVQSGWFVTPHSSENAYLMGPAYDQPKEAVNYMGAWEPLPAHPVIAQTLDFSDFAWGHSRDLCEPLWWSPHYDSVSRLWRAAGNIVQWNAK